MVKDRSKDSTQPTQRGPGRRGGSNIKNEKEYIRKTKARLGDEQALRDHATQHRRGSANPCTEKRPCDQYVRWQLLKWLKSYEIAALLGPGVREMHAEFAEQISAAARSVTSFDHLIPRVRDGIPRVNDGDAVQVARDYLADQRESIEKLRSLVIGLKPSDRFSELLVEQPLHEFRELATGFLGILGYSYQHIAYLVDAHLVNEGDSDRTRKSPAWRAVEAQRKEWAKCPPKKPGVQREQGDQPDSVSMVRPETPPDATSARAERTATKCRPTGAPTPTRRESERRVEQFKHLVDEPTLDEEVGGGPRNL